MASERQIAANRQNAQKSTGPRTCAGKRRSRRNALRHGLTAETVLEQLEDPAEYRAFEKAIIADFAPATAIEQALVLRIASLLWRLKRATAMETGLFANCTPPDSDLPTVDPRPIIHLADACLLTNSDPIVVMLRLILSLMPGGFSGHVASSQPGASGTHIEATEVRSVIVEAFHRLATTKQDSLSLVLRYQTSLSNQLAQTLASIAQVRRHNGFAHLINRRVQKPKQSARSG